MYDDSVLRKFAEWEPLDGWGEHMANEAARAFVRRAAESADVAAFFHEGSYENFAPVFCYLPSTANLATSAAGESQTIYSSLLLYFSHLAPVVALGYGFWGKTIESTGRVVCRSYSGLDLPNLISEEQINEGSLRRSFTCGLQSTGCTVLARATLEQAAPSWFSPLQRSAGGRPWNRLFHVLFQSCD